MTDYPEERKDPEERKPPRKPLRFRHHSFDLRDWERKRVHRYSVKRPAWFSLWLKLRKLAAKVGIR